MGLMSAITGNAGEVAIAEATQALGPVLILVDKQGVTGSKSEYRSIPYRSITNFSVETAGNFDLDAEMKIYVTGNPIPIQREFNKKVNVWEVQTVLAQMVLR